ncbi:short chain dehydrogenase [Arthrobacter sp. Hiyo8]|nr:short chain dehydrogenase [Arthrobacter sp. Hiyo8]
MGNHRVGEPADCLGTRTVSRAGRDRGGCFGVDVGDCAFDPPAYRGPRYRARGNIGKAQDPIPVGRGAWTILALRRVLPDRAFDTVFWNAYKRFSG